MAHTRQQTPQRVHASPHFADRRKRAYTTVGGSASRTRAKKRPRSDSGVHLDSGVRFEGQKSLDDVLRDNRDLAQKEGRVIDLTDDDPDCVVDLTTDDNEHEPAWVVRARGRAALVDEQQGHSESHHHATPRPSWAWRTWIDKHGPPHHVVFGVCEQQGRGQRHPHLVPCPFL